MLFIQEKNSKFSKAFLTLNELLIDDTTIFVRYYAVSNDFRAISAKLDVFKRDPRLGKI